MGLPAAEPEEDRPAEHSSARDELSDQSTGWLNVVTPATVIAFVVFVITDALAGGSTAAIVFWSVLGGLVLAVPLISVTISQMKASRQKEIRRTAALAADLVVDRIGREFPFLDSQLRESRSPQTRDTPASDG
jgi:hypothetical protein